MHCILWFSEAVNLQNTRINKYASLFKAYSYVAPSKFTSQKKERTSNLVALSTSRIQIDMQAQLINHIASPETQSRGDMYRYIEILNWIHSSAISLIKLTEFAEFIQFNKQTNHVGKTPVLCSTIMRSIMLYQLDFGFAIRVSSWQCVNRGQWSRQV